MVVVPVVDDEFPQVAMHVIQSPGVRLQGADWWVVASSVAGVPAENVQDGGCLAVVALFPGRITE